MVRSTLSITTVILLSLPVRAFTNFTQHDCGGNRSEELPFVVSGYLPEYRSYININSTSIHLTDLMLFSLTPESLLWPSLPSCCLSADHYDMIRKAKAHKAEQQMHGNGSDQTLRLLVTIGGGGRSQGFFDIVTGTPETKKVFLLGLKKLCDEEQIDGVDFDFEGIQTIDEWRSYLNLLVPASSFLHNNSLMLTVALHPGQLLPPGVCKVVDRVHLMTYDMFPPPHERSNDISASHKRRGHHASMHLVQDAISSFMGHGCPPEKIILGIPAYARHENNFAMVKTYSEMVDDILSKNDLNAGDLHAKNNWKGYQFDSPSDVHRKVEYAIKTRLGGVFFWEVGQDSGVVDGGLLLKTAATSVLHERKKDMGEEL
mmetsp:Transcript_23737/g.50082  ORF Transcript_23737/g.50082 Transcript_23737/m.50082 type:complete len:372 (+) Transcript_23737:86-1201(+)